MLGWGWVVLLVPKFKWIALEHHHKRGGRSSYLTVLIYLFVSPFGIHTFNNMRPKNKSVRGSDSDLRLVSMTCEQDKDLPSSQHLLWDIGPTRPRDRYVHSWKRTNTSRYYNLIPVCLTLAKGCLSIKTRTPDRLKLLYSVRRKRNLQMTTKPTDGNDTDGNEKCKWKQHLYRR